MSILRKKSCMNFKTICTKTSLLFNPIFCEPSKVLPCIFKLAQSLKQLMDTFFNLRSLLFQNIVPLILPARKVLEIEVKIVTAVRFSARM